MAEMIQYDEMIECSKLKIQCKNRLFQNFCNKKIMGKILSYKILLHMYIISMYSTYIE